MTAFAVTPARLRFFETFGYLHLPGIFAATIGAIDAAFERVIAAHGGATYAGEHRFTVSPGVNGDADLCRLLLDDAGVTGLAAGLLGDDFQFWNSDLNLCAGDTPWHADSPWSGERSTAGWIQMLIHPDPLDAATGALRVVPGSHRRDDVFGREVHEGTVDDAAGRLVHPSQTWGMDDRDLPAVVLPTRPGDAILLDHLVTHASFGGGERRRLINLVFFPRLDEAGLPALRAVNDFKRLPRNRVFPAGAPILADGSPERLRHLEQLRETVASTAAPLAHSFLRGR